MLKKNTIENCQYISTEVCKVKLDQSPEITNKISNFLVDILKKLNNMICLNRPKTCTL